MSLTFNGTDVKSASFNGTPLTRIYYQPKGGACKLVWQNLSNVCIQFLCTSGMNTDWVRFESSGCPYSCGLSGEAGPYCIHTGSCVQVCSFGGTFRPITTNGCYTLCSDTNAEVSITSITNFSDCSKLYVRKSTAVCCAYNLSGLDTPMEHTITASLTANVSCTTEPNAIVQQYRSREYACQALTEVPTWLCAQDYISMGDFTVCATANGRTVTCTFTCDEMKAGVSIAV